MSLIDCTKDPSCKGKVDTDFACKEVSALFGLRLFLDTQLSISVNNDEILQHLEYITKKIEEFKIENVDDKYKKIKMFRQNAGLNIQQPSISRLYIQCSEGHRDYYNVECA